MATRTAAPSRIPRPIPGPAAAPASTRRDYTQPPPGGAHYPWEPGGGSKIPGVPDNWSDFYPNEGEGRGDAWIGPKKAQLNKEHPPGSYPMTPHGPGPAIFGGEDPHAWQPGEIHDTGSTTPNWPDLAIARQQKLNQGYVNAGGTRAGWSKGGPIQGTPQPNPRPSGPLTYTPGGPIPPAAGGPGAPGAAPTGTTASVKGKTQPPATNDQLGKWFGTMKPGASMTIQGKKYFKNQNGAVVDVTNPAARKRITNQQGAFIGQAAAPPPPGAAPTAAPAAVAPTAAPASVDPQQFADMQQQFQQMQQMMQQGFGGGGGGYGGGSYSGMPAQFSGFGNAIMQGMGGGPQMQGMINTYSGMGDPYGMGGGYGGGMQSPYGMVQPDFGYGMPQQFSQGMMGGYGGGFDPYGGMGGGMDQMMGYNAGMGGYGDAYGGMGYY